MRTASWGKAGELGWGGGGVKPSALSPPDKHPHDTVTFSSMLAEYDGCKCAYGNLRACSHACVSMCVSECFVYAWRG